MLKKSASAEKVKVQAKVEPEYGEYTLSLDLNLSLPSRCGLAWGKARFGAPGLGG
jgi:hypothetical protein